jgi:hypothetical protein
LRQQLVLARLPREDDGKGAPLLPLDALDDGPRRRHLIRPQPALREEEAREEINIGQGKAGSFDNG